jgi:tRNA threonylcarbamoyladenosine biosynthesis protein TsaB
VKVLLALDTATAVLSAALRAGDRYWYREADAGLTHSELLLDLAEALLRDAALLPGDLEAVACMRGPGSFTGLRIGFAAAKGMALALGIPLVACPTLDCMAYPWAPWPGLVIPVLDARKKRFFTALYAGGRRVSEEMDAGPRTVEERIARYIRSRKLPGDTPLVVTGPEAPLFLSRLEEETGAGGGAEGGGDPPLTGRPLLDPLYRKGRALELAAVAKDRLIMNNGENDVLSGPEYLRKSDAEE